MTTFVQIFLNTLKSFNKINKKKKKKKKKQKTENEHILVTSCKFIGNIWHEALKAFIMATIANTVNKNNKHTEDKYKRGAERNVMFCFHFK